jgi:hypothetical protein
VGVVVSPGVADGMSRMWRALTSTPGPSVFHICSSSASVRLVSERMVVSRYREIVWSSRSSAANSSRFSTLRVLSSAAAVASRV